MMIQQSMLPSMVQLSLTHSQWTEAKFFNTWETIKGTLEPDVRDRWKLNITFEAREVKITLPVIVSSYHVTM